VLIGAGGSARAVGASLVAAGCADIVVANRTPARGEALAEWLRRDLHARSVRTTSLASLREAGALENAALVVNTTPVGLAGRGVTLRPGTAPRRCLFVDLVYARTPFLAAATRACRPTLDGAGMLLHQGALAFEWWTGRPAPLGAMVLALRGAGLALSRPC
jgi:shikimate dehydrogenase